MAQEPAQGGESQVTVFEHVLTSYNCVNISDARLGRPGYPSDSFKKTMALSLQHWKSQEGYKAVWLTLPVHNGHLVPDALVLGFEPHHCTLPSYSFPKPPKEE